MDESPLLKCPNVELHTKMNETLFASANTKLQVINLSEESLLEPNATEYANGSWCQVKGAMTREK